MHMMTRARGVRSSSWNEFNAQLYAACEEIEAEGHGIKSVSYQAFMGKDHPFYTALIVYGNGPFRMQTIGRGAE